MRFSPAFPALTMTLSLASPAAADLGEKLEALGAAPCETGELTCVSIPVPLDHRANAPGREIAITFAVSLASGESEGLLLYAVGGPGGSGLQVADDYLSAFDAELTERMDIAFFDQRGVGLSEGFACPVAQAALDGADFTLARSDAALDAARNYARDCIAESGQAEIVPFLGTDQAIRDAEAFRLATGEDRLWLYGESYGTQFVQAYARAYPQAVQGVILDGVVDTSLEFEAFYDVYTRESEKLLQRLFDHCAPGTPCGTDMGGDAGAVYDAIAAELAAGPAMVDFPQADGAATPRPLTLAMLETDVFYALYGPGDRADFLRVLAAAARGNRLPLLRLSYANLALDPETLDPVEDPSWFGAAYYGVTCADYPAEAASPAEAEAVILNDAKAHAGSLPRMMRYYFAERLVCANWPVHGPEVLPPFPGGDYPLVVLTSDSDPITPEVMARAVADAARNASVIVMRGGPHVIWGRGLACPDVTVAALLFDGIEPPDLAVCRQDFTDAHVPLTLLSATDRNDPVAIMRGLETELVQSPEIGGWWGEDDLVLGCDHGGTLRASATETGTGYAFSSCAFWPGVVLHGKATETYMGEPGDGMAAELAVTGSATGRISWHHDTWAETEVITGRWNGAPITLPPR